MRCKDCEHAKHDPDCTPTVIGCICPKMLYGYSAKYDEGVVLEPDEVQIENDEGWGMVPGPEFGCIHFGEGGE